MEYQVETGTFPSEIDGLRLYYQRMVPPNAIPGRNIIVHHGFGEHCGRYGNLTDAFLEAGSGVSFYLMDARGHGQSEGKRGDAEGQIQYVRDLEAFVQFTRDQYQVRKPILLGHSMGGAIVLMFALRYSNQWEISAVAASAPALRVHQSPVMHVKRLVGSLLFSLKPDLTVPAGIDLAGLSHDPQVATLYQRDPLVHGDVTTRMALDLLERGEDTIRRAGLLKIPFYAAHGEDDPVTDSEATVEFYLGVKSEDRQLKLYPGLYHEIFNETASERRVVLQDLCDWVLPRFPVERGTGVGPARAEAAPAPATQEAQKKVATGAKSV